jgi:hypothetical protein
MQKDIRIDIGFVEGYGAQGYYWGRVTCDNVLLERLKSYSEYDLAEAAQGAKNKWSREWTPDEWKEALIGKEQASSLCSVCGGHTLDGSSSCVNMTFCIDCRPRIEEFKQKYRDEIAESNRKYELQAKEARERRSADVQSTLAGAFHWRDGWNFKREADGIVRVMLSETTPDGEEYLKTNLTIPPNEWASIVCSVSALGETAERWNAVQDFHGRLDKDVFDGPL